MRWDTIEEANKHKKEITTALIDDEAVVSVATIRDKDTLGKETYFIKIGVKIHTADVMDRLLSKLKKAGVINSEEPSLQGVASHICFDYEGEIKLLNRKSVLRPVKPGYSIGHYQVTAGTLGGIVQFSGKGEKKKFVLSNNHVLANENEAKIGDPIFQPGKADGGTEVVANLSAFIPVSHTTVNYVDAAIAELNEQEKLDCSIEDIGEPSTAKAASYGMFVEKSGRTTAHTTGQIAGTNATVKLKWGGGTAIFDDQITTERSMSEGGDSGSLIFERGTRSPVGLVFAGSLHTTYANPIFSVENAFNQMGYNQMIFPESSNAAKTYWANTLPASIVLSTSSASFFSLRKLTRLRNPQSLTISLAIGITTGVLAHQFQM